MPYQHDDNYETFVECIGKLSATIEDSDMCNFIILGDFNSAVDTPFESELLEFCSAYELTISDYQRYGRGSGQFTYVSDAHNSTSWLDHIICSIVPGFNEHVKELHDIARHDFVMWRSAGKPRFGEICLSMNQSRLRFKSALKYCQQNEIKM